MKRYLIFGALGPFIGGFLLLMTTTLMSGYWTQTTPGEVKNFVVVLFSTLQYTYLFGIVPALLIASIDDILYHIPRIPPLARMIIVGIIASIATELAYGSRGGEQGALQFILYGLVGLVPAMLSSWLAGDRKSKLQTA